MIMDIVKRIFQNIEEKKFLDASLEDNKNYNLWNLGSRNQINKTFNNDQFST